MTPKEKAKELYVKYYNLTKSSYEKHKRTKQCVLIAVDEILKEHYPQDVKRCEYWQEVKQEIENL